MNFCEACYISTESLDQEQLVGVHIIVGKNKIIEFKPFFVGTRGWRMRKMCLERKKKQFRFFSTRCLPCFSVGLDTFFCSESKNTH